MRSSVLCPLLLLALVGSPARAGASPAVDPDVVMTFHTRPHVTTPACAAATSFTGALRCSSYQTRGALNTGYDVYVVATRATAGLAGIEFGLEYDGIPGSGVDVVGWTLCGDYEFPGNGFPGSGGGTIITYDPVNRCRTTRGPDGIVAVFGVLYVYAYGADELAYTPRTYVPDVRMKTANCLAEETPIPPERAATVAFSEGMSVRGFNPCCPNGICNEGPGDHTLPVLVSASGARGSDRVTVQFSEPVGAGAATAGNYRVSPGPGGSPAFSTRAAAVSGSTVTLTLSAVLAPATLYTVTVSGVADLAGNLIVPGSTVQFETEALPPDTTPPELLAANGARDTDVVRLQFSEEVGAGATVAANYVVAPGPGGADTFPIHAVSASGSEVTVTLAGLLAPSTLYTVTVSGVADLAGNVIAPGSSAQFQTEPPAPVDTTPPVLLSARGVAQSTVVLVTFSETVDAGADIPSNYVISRGPDQPAAFTVVLAEAGGDRVDLTLSGRLDYNTTYYVTVTGVHDLAGNPVAPGSRVSFRTGYARDVSQEPLIALHLKHRSTKSQCTTNAPRSLPCDDFTIQGVVGASYDLYVTVVDPHTPAGIAGVAFGVSYPAPTRLAVYSWSLCGDLQFPGQGFPASGGGNTITWDRFANCQTTVVDGRIQAVAGYFYVYAYAPALFEITRRNVAVPDINIATCAAQTVPVPFPIGAGKIGFGAPGYNPCLGYSPPLNVETTTWGAIKRTYRPTGRD